jgi:L,D-peptidoglycan transpeptidase YkuD (ErfK/YbiS/YcfS/YnhG family)
VIISRRVLFGAVLATLPPPSPTNLAYAGGKLTWPGGSTRAACGWGGITAGKREGDGASPAGTFALVSAFYRPDRLAMPRTELAITALRPEMGWVDDPADPNYNRLVTLPYAASHEDLWRDDALYDVIVVIGYNTGPVVPGAGSAIFLHVAQPDFAPTEGCIAIAKPVLLSLLGLLGPGSTITIRGEGTIAP